ncbi:hypothetical protein A3I56_00165 [Candidatus Roizmanbacteria bacterium RIFCSPLOWO2_02_FULL_43_10]|uniref:VWFA domain-containing protein n=1 Tax=Candidatus Roizmanbacteria bacterium RIFCSPLOWO2_02_FULL_43_10 TaxID=1802078 RepID=A0A1F7JUB8_9BACT|nr:MAG: hypothetical protein A3I56_00165 [Candidatus Roizmanbacteria bacterium RIFCSPLOWO2_02_FULL_43_10]
MNRFHSQHTQRGEVAWLLTVVSMVVIAAGMLIGFNVSTQEEPAVRVAPRAAEPTASQARTPTGTPIGSGRVLEQTGRTADGRSIRNTDGMFVSIGGQCQATFDTQIDPTITRLLIARPTSNIYPRYSEANTFDLTTNGAEGLIGKSFLKNNSVIVRFDPNDATKNTPNLNDVLVKYQSSAGDTRIVIDESKVPSWIRTENVDVVLVFKYTPKGTSEFFTTAVSTGCVVPSVTPFTTPTDIPTATPSGEPIVTLVFPSETPTATPTDEPIVPLTRTPRSTPASLTCTYNATAFVEECRDVDRATGKCKDVSGASRYLALPFKDTVLNPNPGVSDNTNKWGIANEAQRGNRDRWSTLLPASLMKMFSASEFSKLAAVHSKFDFSTNVNKQTGTYTGLSGFSESSTQQVASKTGDPAELLTRRDFKINVPSQLEKEQYTNFSTTDAYLYFDQKKYAVLPEGSKIYTCTNDIAASIDKNDPRAKGIGACDMDEYGFFGGGASDPLIPGLVVGCGQNIVYGWTLHQCKFDFDYVFVLDTSSTMGNTVDNNFPDKRTKLAAAKEAINTFLQQIKTSSPGSRVGLVTFNTGWQYYSQSSAGTWLFDERKGLGIKKDFVSVDTFLRDVNIAALPYQAGTCIECGLADAKMLLDKRADKTRKSVTILLTDGQPNSYNDKPGFEVLPLGFSKIFETGDKLRADGKQTIVTNPESQRNSLGNNNVADDTLLVSIGYGDTSVNVGDGQNFRVLYGLASDRKENGKRWAYSTDPKVLGKTGTPYDISTVFNLVQKDVNTCAEVNLSYEKLQKAKDVNNDGIVNTLDLFLVFDNYYAKGDNLKEDINGDGIVNVNDITLVIESLGSVVTPADRTATPAGRTNR